VIGYLDCSTGVSGDKLLGALLDAGASAAEKGLPPFGADDLARIVADVAPEARVTVERVRSHGIAAVGVKVEAAEQPPSRTWADIRIMLESAPLPASARDRAFEAFDALARAEAAAHGTEVESVHFHEVGAIDSIADIVGVCAGLHALGVTRLLASPVATGSGTVATSHGVLPVPAPATAELLLGVPTVAGPTRPDGSPAGELTTPTGAALLRVCADGFGAAPPLTPTLIGYGAGTRDIGLPNVCRLILGEPAETRIPLDSELVVVLETNVDHISPEAASFAAEQLIAEGALDVWQTPVTMKKGRSAFTLSALVATDLADEFASRIVELTGTLGVRRIELPRYVADREARVVDTEWGPVRLKIGAGRVRPEHDDVAAIARRTGRAYSDVAREIALLHSYEDEE